MALLYDSRFAAKDANGAVLVGATLTVKNAGTATLSSIYRDNALSTPMTNPTSGPDVSDAAGRFPQIFLAEGGLYDITLKTSGGVTVTTYLNVTSLGPSTSTFTRDFGNSRARIAGSGGVVSYEAGDPTGDDVGGQLRIGGYNGTQADTLSLDGAAVNTTGILKENSKKLYGVVAASGSVSAAANIIINLPTTISGVMLYDVDLFSIKCSASPTLTVNFSYDNGATYDTTSAYATNGGGLATAGTLIATLGTGNGYFHSRLRFQQNDAGGNGATLAGYTVPGSAAMAFVGITRPGNATPVTHIKITPSSGTITGNWRVVPLRGTGDA